MGNGVDEIREQAHDKLLQAQTKLKEAAARLREAQSAYDLADVKYADAWRRFRDLALK